MIKFIDWHNCYDLSWKGIIVDEAFSHPAKFSHALIRRIYQHALEEGWLKPGDTVVDPFGGVGLGALYAMKNGLNWVGRELEQKFVDLGQQNIAKWNREYAVAFPNWGHAILVQGDSRRLAEVVREAGLVVSSPPYADGCAHQGGDDTDNSHIEGGKRGAYGVKDGYGDNNTQLANLPEGDITIISSPSWAGNTGGRGEASRNGIDAALFDRHSGGMKRGTGDNPQNLDHLKEGDIGAVISSPPYENSLNSEKNGIDWTKTKKDYPGRTNHQDRIDLMQKNHNERRYGECVGQLGADSGETFWQAARAIVEQCYLILPPGGMSIWVTKRYVKKGQIVDFTGNWVKLCESVGFELVCHHRAWLVKNRGAAQLTMDGDEVNRETHRKSFFRRLHEKKRPDLSIDWEDVVCLRKVSRLTSPVQLVATWEGWRVKQPPPTIDDRIAKE